MRWAVVVGLFVAATVLSGCFGDSDEDALGPVGAPGEEAAETAGESDEVATGQRPAPWAVGHYWSYRTSFGTDFTLVVTEDQGNEWFLDTTNPDTAWFHVRDEISYLENVRKDDLAGSQGGDRVQYFNFPLKEGDEWTTSWDGADRRIVTVEANETFRFEAYESDQLIVEYDYDPEVGWFTQVTFYEGPDGSESFSFELSDHQIGWTGEVVRWDAENHLDLNEEVTIAGALADSFNVAEDVQELWIHYWFHCEDNHNGLAFIQGTIAPVPPLEGMALLIDGCMEEEVLPVFEEPAAGQWEFAAVLQSLDPDHLAIVELEIWSRNLVVIDLEPVPGE